MTTEAELPTNADPEVQRVLGALVSHEVYLNVGRWVQALTDTLQTGGSTDEVDYGDPIDWWRGEEDRAEAVCNAGYSLTEDEAGNWYWYEAGSPKPFGDAPPSDYEIEEVPDDAQQMEELGVDQFGWYWGWVTVDYDKAHRCDTYEEAVVACWTDDGPEAFDDEEDAINDCIDTESLEDEVEESRGEVYEHWAVSPSFGYKLERRGEKVFELCGTTIWGRCCTGQAIKLDHVIWEIGRDMEILPGQVNHCFWVD